MNSRWPWLVGIAITLAVGWLLGYAMGGGTAVQPAGTPRPTYSPEGATTRREEKEREQLLFRSMRESFSVRSQHDVYAALLQMSPEQIARAIERVPRFPEQSRQNLLGLLFERWAQMEPQAAAERAMTCGPQESRNVLWAVRAWARADPTKAREWALALPLGDQRSYACLGVIQGLQEKDPIGAFRFLDSLPKDMILAHTQDAILRTWAERNPAAAAAYALTMRRDEERERAEAISTTMLYWMKSDPQAALAWVAQIPQRNLRQQVDRKAHAWWASYDRKAALRAVLALSAGEERDGTIAAILDNTMTSGAAGPEEWALIERLPAGEPRNSNVARFAGSASYNDLMGTLVWLAKLPDNPTRKAALEGISRGQDAGDFTKEADFVLNGDPAQKLSFKLEEKLRLLNGFAMRWAEYDQRQAIEWGRKIEDEAIRGQFMAGVVNGIYRGNPQAAAELLAELPVDSRIDLARSIGDSWNLGDSEAATAWALRLPEDRMRRVFIEAIVTGKLRASPVRAAEWLKRLPDGTARDGAVRWYAQETRETDPADATAWAATIADGQERINAVKEAVRSWLRRDRPAATEWLQQSGTLDAAAKQKLLSEGSS
jgi:hypothetical protein